MKTLEFASKIKQPLLGVQAEVKLGVQFAFDILSSEGCESDSFFSKIHRKVSRIFNFQFRSHNFHNCVISYSVWRKGNEQNSIRLVKESSEGCESNSFFLIFTKFHEFPNSKFSKQSGWVLFGLMNRQQQMNNSPLDCCKLFCENLEFVKLCGDQLIYSIFLSYTILQKVFLNVIFRCVWTRKIICSG